MTNPTRDRYHIIERQRAELTRLRSALELAEARLGRLEGEKLPSADLCARLADARVILRRALGKPV